MRLEYVRAPGLEAACPDEESFRQMAGVLARGEDPFSASAAGAVRVTLDRRGRAYHATIAAMGPDGAQRGNAEEHTMSTCPEVAREAASTAFLMVSPFAVPAAEPLPAPQPPAPPPAAERPRPLPPTSPSRRMLVQIGAGAAAVAGFSPNPSAGFGGFAGLRFPGAPSWSISLEGRADVDTTGERFVLSTGKGSAKVSAGFTGGSLAPCVHAWWLFGCAVVTVGRVEMSLGENVQPHGGGMPYAGIGGRAGLEVPIVRLPARPALALQVFADGLVTVSRPGVVIEGEAAPAWQAPPGAGVLGARLVTIF